MRKNSADNYEPITVCLTPDKTPIAYRNRVECLMSSGLPRKVAESFALEPIELELYYEVGWGLMAVESEAVESNIGIFSPYTGEEYDESISCPECGDDNVQAWMDESCNVLKYRCAKCGEIFNTDRAERR